MKLYEVTNGLVGNSYIRCYVIAHSPERAIELGKEVFSSQYSSLTAVSNLRVEEICSDLTSEWTSDLTD